MKTEDDIYYEAYKWITPIMIRGGKAEVEAFASVGHACDKSAPAIAALRAELTDVEQVIYYCEYFSSLCNMTGLIHFFSCGISFFYYEVIAALGVIGAEEMIEDLTRCKQAIFDDEEVPVHDVMLMEDFTYSVDPAREKEMKSIDDISSCERLGAFHKQLEHYVLTCAEKGLLKKPIG
jgi:hypothetical protein